ncbi:MAG: hypothetical protein J0I16_13950 [Rhizobiales bacterium]|nr:hypothetical protein [Hyphomicrobiales bacterium]
MMVTPREWHNALEAHDILEIIAGKLGDRSDATTIAIETELALRIHLCAAFRQRIVKLPDGHQD